jgi:chromate transport protein ChrA
MPSLDIMTINLFRLVEGVPLSRLAAYFLHLGTIGFGGPIALVSYMQRDLVEPRQWIWL